MPRTSKSLSLILCKLILAKAAIQSIKVLIGTSRDFDHSPSILVSQGTSLPLRILPCDRDSIPDLVPIHLFLLHIFQMVAQIRDIKIFILPKRLKPIEVPPDP